MADNETVMDLHSFAQQLFTFLLFFSIKCLFHTCTLLFMLMKKIHTTSKQCPHMTKARHSWVQTGVGERTCGISHFTSITHLQERESVQGSVGLCDSEIAQM